MPSASNKRPQRPPSDREIPTLLEALKAAGGHTAAFAREHGLAFSKLYKAQRAWPEGREAMRELGVDHTERGHFVPAHSVVRRFERQKLACPAGHSVVAAKAPEPLVRRAK